MRRLGLATPCLSEIQDRIIANFAARGIEVVADRRLEDLGNYSFAEYAPQQIFGMVREVAAARPDAIAILCANFRGVPIAAEAEAELGIPVLDSVAATAARTLSLIGVPPGRVQGWGSVFDVAFAE